MQDIKVGKLSKTYLISLTFIEVDEEAAEITPAMTEVMTEAKEILDEDHMIETEEGMFYSEVNLEFTKVQKGYTEDKTITEIEVTVDNKGSEVNQYHHLEHLELHKGLPVVIRTDV